MISGNLTLILANSGLAGILVTLAIPLVILLVLGVTISRVMRSVRRNIGDVSQLIESAKSHQRAMNSARSGITQSLQSMESVVMPQIKADFPELNIEAMRSQVSNDLKSFFENERRPYEALSERVRRYYEWWQGFIAQNPVPASVDGLSVDRVVIKDYNREPNRRRIVWQAGFYFSDAQISRDTARVDVIYTYDLKTLSPDGELVTAGLNCPNCGAPATNVGEKRCAFCHTPLNANWDLIWKLSSVQS